MIVNNFRERFKITRPPDVLLLYFVPLSVQSLSPLGDAPAMYVRGWVLHWTGKIYSDISPNPP